MKHISLFILMFVISGCVTTGQNIDKQTSYSVTPITAEEEKELIQNLGINYLQCVIKRGRITGLIEKEKRAIFGKMLVRRHPEWTDEKKYCYSIGKIDCWWAGKELIPTLREEIFRRNPAWSDRVKDTIMKGEIYIGMTDDQVKASWGLPKDINRSVGSWGVHEQWIYKKNKTYYLYVKNNVLTSWQD